MCNVTINMEKVEGDFDSYIDSRNWDEGVERERQAGKEVRKEGEKGGRKE